MAVYAVSDLHGQYDVFVKGLNKIRFCDQDTLYVIGDVIDRGPEGIRLLQYIREHGNMELLLGNHEVMMLGSVDPNGEKECNGEYSELWLYYNGGFSTFREYILLSVRERMSLLMWLNRCRIIRTVKAGERKICLTHSYYDPEVENRAFFEAGFDAVWDVVWKSMFREDDDTQGDDIYKDYDYLFVTGHVPVQRVRIRREGGADFNVLSMYETGNLVDIDGGCALGKTEGVNNGAIFLRLEDMKEFPVLLCE